MKKLAIAFTIILFLIPTLGFSHAISFRVGYFIPRAQSDLWDIEFENMDFTLSNFQNSTFGFVYEHFLTKEISLTFNIDGYTKNRAGVYKDYVGYSFDEGDFAFPNSYKGDFAISHVFNVSITPIQASVKFTPLGRRASFIPYIGGGAGLYLWSVRLQGDMVDFNDVWLYEDEDPTVGDIEIFPIYITDAREENRFSVGFHAFAGVMVPVGRRIAIEAEFKYNFLKGKFKDAFEGFEPFDLGGFQISLGLNYWF